MTKDDYAAYLATPEWKKRRAAAVKRAGGRCQLCYSTKTLNVHHRTYLRVGDEEPGDLIVLCRRCHAKHHDVLPDGVTKGTPVRAKPKKRKREISELARGNRSVIMVEINALFDTYPGQGWTAKDLADRIGTKPPKVGAVLSEMRKSRVVRKQGKRWFPTGPVRRLAVVKAELDKAA